MNTTSFQQMNLSSELLRAVENLGYREATAIQAEAIPLILQGRDVVGRSNTGTGKTAAFGIPAVERVVETASSRPQVLILCPTRELAMQIAEELKKLAQYKSGVRIATLYGGQSIEVQLRQLRTANLVVGTPGRVMDHMERRSLRLEEVGMVVLDEADEMLNMGFLEDIRSILSQVPEQRQTILFSATMPPAILSISRQFQQDPQVVEASGGSRTLDAISQYYYRAPSGAKMDVLNLLLQYHDPHRSIVFCNTKKMVDELTEYLNRSGFKAAGLHGDMQQAARTQVMNAFKSGQLRILAATDVAARGIDVEGVDAVFNYDIPQDPEYYIHRIGRTARAGRTGSSYTLAASFRQVGEIRQLRQYTRSSIAEASIPTPEEILARRQEALLFQVRQLVKQDTDLQWEELVEQLSAEGFPPEKVAAALLCASADRNRRPIPVVQPPRPAREEREQGRPFGSRRGGGRVRVSVDIGRESRVLPNHIVGAIVERTGLPSRAIGKIDIHSDYTLVDLSHADAQLVLSGMKGQKIRGRRVTVTLAARNVKDVKDARNAKDVKGATNVKDMKGFRSAKDVKDATNVKDMKGIRSSENVKDATNVKDVKHVTDVRKK